MKKTFATLVLIATLWFTALADHTVTVKLDYDDTELTPIRVDAVTKGKIYRKSLTPRTHQVTLSLPDGTYDFHLEMCRYNPTLPDNAQGDYQNPYTHIFAEDVAMDSDITLTLDAATATNLIEFKAYTPDGKPFLHPQAGSSGMTPATTLQAEAIGLDIYHTTYGEIQYTHLAPIYSSPENISYSRCLDMWVNDVSSRYIFSQTRIALALDGTPMLLGMATRGIPSGPVTNLDEPFTPIEPVFTPTPASKSWDVGSVRSAIDINATVAGAQINRGSFDFTTTSPRFLIGWSRDIPSECAIQYAVTPAFVESDDSRNSGPAILLTPRGQSLQSLTNPAFTWPESLCDITPGATVPLTSAIMYRKKIGTNYCPDQLAVTTSGRLGETRASDLQVMTAQVTHGADLVFSDILPDLPVFFAKWNAETHDNAPVAITLTNRNIEIEGFASPSSTTVITYTEGKNDICPPSAQMLTLSDASTGILSHHFPAYGADITLDIAAADPNGLISSITGNGSLSTNSLFNSRTTRQVRAETAPSGTARFTEITLSETRAGTSSTAWATFSGTIPRSALTSTGWYDLRITLTDNDGNTSVQTLSPAFSTGEFASSGLPRQEQPTLAAIARHGHISVKGVPDGTPVALYDSAGTLLTHGHAPEIKTVLTPGIYFLSTGTQTVKILWTTE